MRGCQSTKKDVHAGMCRMQAGEGRLLIHEVKTRLTRGMTLILTMCLKSSVRSSTLLLTVRRLCSLTAFQPERARGVVRPRRSSRIMVLP
jgi:hypothetical protein